MVTGGKKIDVLWRGRFHLNPTGPAVLLNIWIQLQMSVTPPCPPQGGMDRQLQGQGGHGPAKPEFPESSEPLNPTRINIFLFQTMLGGKKHISYRFSVILGFTLFIEPHPMSCCSEYITIYDDTKIT